MYSERLTEDETIITKWHENASSLLEIGSDDEQHERWPAHSYSPMKTVGGRTREMRGWNRAWSSKVERKVRGYRKENEIVLVERVLRSAHIPINTNKGGMPCIRDSRKTKQLFYAM